MKIDFSQTFVDYEGNPALMEDESELTLCDVVLVSLNKAQYGTIEESVKAGKLSFRIYGAEELEVTPEEVVFMRQNMSLHYSPMIIAQAHEMLEGDK